MREPTPDELRRQLAMMSRRRFLGRSSLALGGLALGPTLLAACGGDDGGGGGGSGDGATASTVGLDEFEPTSSDTLRVSNWPFYIDEETVGLFEDASGLSVAYTEDVNDNEEYFSRIREPLSRGDDIGADMFVVTDFMVNRLIGLGWLAPINDENVPNKANLVASLQDMDFDPDRRYSLPWFSGFTSIAYNPELTGREITSLEDLFDPEFAGQVTMFSDLRDGLGMILLLTGGSPATATPEEIEAAIARVQEAKDAGQIRRFTGNDYGDDLVAGNTAIAQAYSGDVAQLQLDNPDLQFVVPEEGMTTWSDNMVMPITTANSTGAEQWMDYVYDPANMARITEYVQFIPPVEGTGDELPTELRENPLINPPQEWRDAGVAWRGLSDEEDQQFSALYADVTRA
jgi:spermidine/putrescine transport system substrate-binding protein